MQIFQLTPKLYIDDEPINNLEHELKSQDFKHIFIVCSSSGFSSLALNETIDIIKKLKIQYFIYQIENNVVDANEVFEASILFEKKRSNLIIAIGGNKAVDFAKVLAIYTPNKSLHHSVWHYMNDPAVLKTTAYPVVSIPLTFTTGSCSNGLSIVYNHQKEIAQGVVSFTSIPSIVIFDEKYLKSINNKQLNEHFLYIILNCLNNILNFEEENWYWTNNYNYCNLISIIRAIITLKQNLNHKESWNILMIASYFNGSNLSKFNNKFSYDLLSLFLGINGFLRLDYTYLINQLFFAYCEEKSNIDPTFKDNIIKLNKKMFNKDFDTLNELKTYLHKFIEFNENNFYLNNKQLINNMIEKAIIQYQKNYLDALDINKEKYQELQDKATILFTKVIYKFFKEEK